MDRHDYSYFLNGFDPGSDGLAKMALKDVSEKSRLSAETLEQAQVRLFGGKGNLLKERLGFASFDGQDILRRALSFIKKSSRLQYGREYHIVELPSVSGHRRQTLSSREGRACPAVHSSGNVAGPPEAE